jgi:hypothetical protein
MPDYKDTVTHIDELLQQTFGDYFKVYYKGLPSQTPPEAAYPCVIVYKQTASYSAGASQSDDMTEAIMIHLMSNRMDSMGSDNTIDTVMRELEEKVEGREPATAEFKQGTLMHALRYNLTLDASIIDSTAAITYSSTPRRDAAFIAEADIQLNITARVTVLNRH